MSARSGSRRTARQRLAAYAAAFVVTLLLSGWAVPHSAGMAYTTRVTEVSTDQDGNIVRQPVVVAHARTLGASARVDFERGNEEVRAGDYLVTTDRGATLTLVSPSRRQIIEVSAGTLGAEFASEMRGKARVSNQSVRVEFPPADPDASGAGRVRIVRSFQMRIRVMLVRHIELRVQESLDYWLSPSVRGVPNPLLSYLVGTADAQNAADSALSARAREASSRVGDAFVTRWVHRADVADGRRRRETVTTMETSDMAPADVRPELFDLPRDFARRAAP